MATMVICGIYLILHAYEWEENYDYDLTFFKFKQTSFSVFFKHKVTVIDL